MFGELKLACGHRQSVTVDEGQIKRKKKREKRKIRNN